MTENLKPNKNHQSVYAEDVGLEKSSYLKETLVQTSQKSKELWKTLKSLGLPSEEGKRSKVLLNKYGTIQFKPQENPNIFEKFKKSLILPNEFCSSTTSDYYADIVNNKKNEFQLINISKNIVKNGLNFCKLSEKSCRSVCLSIHKIIYVGKATCNSRGM